MKLNVLFFAAARDAVGQSPLQLELPATATVADLKRQLSEQYTDLQPLQPHLLIAVNSEYVGDEHALQPADEVACFPPVSGG